MQEAAVATDAVLPEEHKHWAYIPAAVLVVVGFALEVVVYASSSGMHYVMRGMGSGTMMTLMYIGMGAMLAGLVLAWWSLFPSVGEIRRRRTPNLQVRARDSQRLTTAHWLVVIGMTLAVAIDFMKPITVGFVLPGFKSEYSLTGAEAACLAFFGIGGTAIASVFWGWMADRVGRRGALLYTSLVFIVTSSCGSMVHWQTNVAMCCIMGLASGGLLPVALAFLAEVLPSRHRGWMMVVIGGELGLAYAASSWLATWLTPAYSWRMLWLVGAPLGLFLVVFSYLIPESPRFLLTVGQKAKAEAVLRRYGMTATDAPAEPVGGVSGALPVSSSFASLLSPPLAGRTMALGLLGLSAGLVNYGFILWLPTNLSSQGVSVQAADRLLAHSSLISLPAVILVAILYNVWSSKRTMVLACGVTFAALVLIVIVGPTGHLALEALIVATLCGNAALYATLGPFAGEMYPTYLRSAGTGFAQGWGRLGGVIGPGLVVASLTPPGLVAAAAIAIVPTAMAAMGIGGLTGETRRRPLEELGVA
jgi:putative MFS transporter